MKITQRPLHALLRSRMSEKSPLTAWDAEASAIVGALGGFTIGGTYKVSEAFFVRIERARILCSNRSGNFRSHRRGWSIGYPLLCDR